MAKRYLSIFGAMLFCLALPLFGFAQNNEQSQSTTPQTPAQVPEHSQQRAAEIQEKLTSIQEEALADHPELLAQGEALQLLINDTMKELGANPDADAKRLQAIQQKAKAGEIEESERQALTEEFKTLQMGLMKARQTAMQDKQIKQKQTELQSAMIDAMQEQDPETEKLLAEIQTLQIQMQGTN